MAVLSSLPQPSAIQFAGIVLSTFIIRALYLRYFHPLSRYPGPFWAIQTDFWKLIVVARKEQHIVDKRLHEVYGPIVRDGPNSLRFLDLEAYKTIYGFKNFERTDFYTLSGEPDTDKRNLFQLISDEQHRVRRKQLSFPSFSAKSIASYEPIISTNLGLWIEKISQSLPTDGAAINIAPRIRYLTMDIITEVIHGCSMGYIAADHDLHGLIAEKEMIAWISNTIPQVHWLGRAFGSRPVWSLLRRPKYDTQGRLLGIGAMVDFSSKLFRTAVAEGAKATPPSVLRGMLESPPDAEKSWGIKQKGLELGNLFFAGTGSTAAGISAILNHVGMHTSWQKRILSEITPLVDSKPTDIPPYLPYPSLSKLPILRAVVRESLRLTPPFASAFERQIAKGVEAAIPGLPSSLPLGTRVACNISVITTNKIVFGDDANEWKPERWLIEDEGKLRQMDDAWAVFGRGSRMCIAKDIAMMFLIKVIAEMVLKWEMEVEKGSMKSINAFEMQVQELPITLKAR